MYMDIRTAGGIKHKMNLDWVVGNRWVWSQVIDHIQEDRDKLSPDSVLFLLGAPGIGKTYHVKKIMEMLSCDPYFIDSMNCANGRELRDMLQKGTNPYLVTRADVCNSSQKRVIVMDDIDILISMDRTLMTAFCNILQAQQYAHAPIICIGHMDMEKKIGSVKAKCKIVKCPIPDDIDICMMLQHIPTSNKKTKRVLLQIAEECRGNLNYAIQKVQSHGYQKLIRESFSKAWSIGQHMLDDPWMIPLRYHENLPKLMTMESSLKTSLYADTVPYFCVWDLMMNHPAVEADMAVELLAHAIASCVPDNMNSQDGLEDFTKLLSNLSLQKKNERLLYPDRNFGFPWIHAQIFCDYSKQKWT